MISDNANSLERYIMFLQIFAPPGSPPFDIQYTLQGTPADKKRFEQWLFNASNAYKKLYALETGKITLPASSQQLPEDVAKLQQQIEELKRQNQQQQRKNKELLAALEESGLHTKECECCGKTYISKRSDGKYCSGACRVMAHRTRQATA